MPEENLIPLFGVGQLQALLQDAEGGRTGIALRSLADRLGIDEATFDAISAAAGVGLMQTVIPRLQQEPFPMLSRGRQAAVQRIQGPRARVVQVEGRWARAGAQTL